jgi:DNA-binding transcriptional ArsR family regulator
MPIYSPPIDRLFQALGDPTRLAVVERLARGPASVSELAAPAGMALPSFLQHLKVLETAGLIRSEKIGRTRTCRLEPAVLKAAQGWIETQRAAWTLRLDALEDFIAEQTDAQNESQS